MSGPALLTNDDVRTLLRAHVEKCYGSQAEAGRIWGVSSAFVNMVLSGKKVPTPIMLENIGVKRVLLYQKTGT